jgi:hypothetical protein
MGCHDESILGQATWWADKEAKLEGAEAVQYVECYVAAAARCHNEHNEGAEAVQYVECYVAAATRCHNEQIGTSTQVGPSP